MVTDADDVAEILRYAQELAAEAAELRLKVRWLEQENNKLRRRLNRVYRSWTWRVGRVVLVPYYVIQWVRGKIRKPRFPT